MVARKFVVRHNDSSFDVDYDTDDGIEVFKFQLFSLTAVLPGEQKIIGGKDGCVLSEDSDLISISDQLRLVSIGEEVNTEGRSSGQQSESLKSDEEFARMLQAEEEALLLQQAVASDHWGEMEKRLRPYVDQVLMYEDLNRQVAALKTVPVDDLKEKALVSLAKEGKFIPSQDEEDHAFLLQLLFWFKQSFRWVNALPCDKCGSETRSQGMGAALPSEILFGGFRVELYCCNICAGITRFPRYNDPLKLLETRSGRCGEWANCFTLYCRAFGYDSRLILDFTDHVWTECFSHHLGRWMHLDPCEGIYDTPLLYEKGWNKKLDYIIAIAKDGVYDVTKRYTKKWHEVLSRRNMITEPALTALLSSITKECRKDFSSEMHSKCEERDRNEAADIDRSARTFDDSSISLPGRQSGDKTWRILRQEFVSDEKCFVNFSSCPVRLCIDEHVSKICKAFFPVLSGFVEESLSKSRAIDILEDLKGALADLRKLNFRMRRTSSRTSASTKRFLCGMQAYFSELMDALSLKSECDGKGVIDICLGGDPIKTSLALPVALDALDAMIHHLSACDKLDMDSISLPFLKFHRMHSGSILASGEELPFGIATSAFDGIQTSKWEEPNGGRGCWMIYRVFNDEMVELVAYEFMSANDAPERDPMEWVVEGSDDGGCRWHVVDERSGEVFEGRFQRKTFAVKSGGLLSNIFRLRFVSVRDAQATSRLQLGSIHLYASSSLGVTHV